MHLTLEMLTNNEDRDPSNHGLSVVLTGTPAELTAFAGAVERHAREGTKGQDGMGIPFVLGSLVIARTPGTSPPRSGPRTADPAPAGKGAGG